MAKRHVLVLRAEGPEYTIPQTRIAAEVDLQEAFKSHPELIPVEDLGLGALLVVGRETSLASGGVADLLAVDPQGHVVLAEFKKGPENPDSRRVMAQVLEYASCLWRMPYEEFDESIAQRYFRGPLCADDGARQAANLEEAAAACWGDQENFSVDDFRQGVIDTLSTGKLSCVIISGEIDENTRRVIDFLNATARFRCFGVQVEHFADAERRIFVPRAVAVPPTGKRPRGAAVPKTTKENFLATCGEPARSFYGELLRYMESTGETLYWGTVGFSFRIDVAGAKRTVFYGYPRGAGGYDWDEAWLVISELRKGGVVEEALCDYTSAAASLSIKNVTDTGSVRLAVDEKAEASTEVVIESLRRLLAVAKQVP